MTERNVLFDQVPQELRRQRCWLGWRAERRGSKLTKVPCSPSTGWGIDACDPSNLVDFETARIAAETGRTDGIGFAFLEGEPYLGIDLDQALVDGNPKPWAAEVIRRLPSGAFVEISPSGHGLHSIVRAQKPGPNCKKVLTDGVVEIYDGRRYFTVTGDLFRPTAPQIVDAQDAVDKIYRDLFGPEPAPRSSAPVDLPAHSVDDEEVLRRAFHSVNGERIRRLFDGDSSAYGGDRSRGDHALLNHFWFWSGGNAEQTKRLFLGSRRCREKSLSRADYLDRSLAKFSASDVYRPGPAVPPTGSFSAGIPAESDAAFAETHKANACRIRDTFREHLRFVPGVGFLTWQSSGRWAISDDEARWMASGVSRLIRQEARDLEQKAAGSTDETARELLMAKAKVRKNWARKSEQLSNIKDSLNLAKPLIKLAPDRLDAEPLLLNLKNGILNLESGGLSAHSPRHFLTHHCPVNFDSEVRAPRWRRFVDEITGGDRELAHYLQKAVGYSATGLVSEQCFFLVVGNGSNGKSTFMDTLGRVLGNTLVTKTPANFLIASKSERHPSELACLRGSRIANAQETPTGSIFDSQRIKELTGESRIRARMMHRDWIDIPVTWKLWIVCNEPPGSWDLSHAFRRRVHLIPFEHMCRHPDRRLVEKLAAEVPGILNWIAEGTRHYLKEGLELPPIMRRRLDQYFGTADSLTTFITTHCKTQPGGRVKAGEFQAAYSRFCRAEKMPALHRNEIAPMLHDRGFQRSNRSGQGYFYLGLVLA